MQGFLDKFAEILLTASDAELDADVTLGGRLIIDRAGDGVVSYAPFEHLQTTARVVIVGITPGEQQTRNALVAARKHLLGGSDPAAALAAAKVFASFSGPMRSNLVAMFDHIGLNRWLGVETSASLWTTDAAFVHFTSALRCPVFVGGRNYSGQPSMLTTPVLFNLLNTSLREEATMLNRAAWIPLGPKALVAVDWLVQQGILRRAQVLSGVPHPSGANAERIAYFLGRKKREVLSVKTDPVSLDTSRERLIAQIAALR
jgi:hypothetical protein